MISHYVKIQKHWINFLSYCNTSYNYDKNKNNFRKLYNENKQFNILENNDNGSINFIDNQYSSKVLKNNLIKYNGFFKGIESYVTLYSRETIKFVSTDLDHSNRKNLKEGLTKYRVANQNVCY